MLPPKFPELWYYSDMGNNPQQPLQQPPSILILVAIIVGILLAIVLPWLAVRQAVKDSFQTLQLHPNIAADAKQVEALSHRLDAAFPSDCGQRKSILQPDKNSDVTTTITHGPDGCDYALARNGEISKVRGSCP